MVASSRPFFDTNLYTVPQILLYVFGFLLWTPAYVAIIVRAFRDGQMEEPMLAACGNIGWEFYWGFFVTVNMGWGLQAVYVIAFLLDLLILYNVYRVGWKQSRTVDLRRIWPVLVTLALGALVAFYATLQREGYDLPLGTNSAYIDNILVSGLYLWFGMTRSSDDLSLTVSWSKMIGTGMVSVFVFWVFPHNGFIKTLAVITAMLDLSYFALLWWRRRRRLEERPDPLTFHSNPSIAITP